MSLRTACPRNAEPLAMITSCRAMGSPARFPVASIVVNPGVVPTIGVLACCAGGNAGVSPGAKLRVSPAAAADVVAAASAGFAPPVMLVALSAMKVGVGM
jgi:hypothetical protein